VRRSGEQRPGGKECAGTMSDRSYTRSSLNPRQSSHTSPHGGRGKTVVGTPNQGREVPGNVRSPSGCGTADTCWLKSAAQGIVDPAGEQGDSGDLRELESVAWRECSHSG
jgi:hypothetical protein